MDITVNQKMAALHGAVLNKSANLKSFCNYVGFSNSRSGNALAYYIEEYVMAAVEYELYRIVTGPDYFGYVVQSAAAFAEKQDGNTV